MPYVPPARSFEGIDMRDIVEKADTKYFKYHDYLQDCYIDGLVFTKGAFSVDFGALKAENIANARTVFNKIHALIQHLHILYLHAENLKLGLKNRYPTGLYNALYDADGNIINTKTKLATVEVARLKTLGVEFSLE